MKGTNASLRLYITINDMNATRASLGRGLASHCDEPQDHHPELNDFDTKEGHVETAQLAHADEFRLPNSSVCLGELLCWHYQNMSNQQGMRTIYVKSLPKSTRIQKSRTGQFVSTGTPFLNLNGIKLSTQGSSCLRRKCPLLGREEAIGLSVSETDLSEYDIFDLEAESEDLNRILGSAVAHAMRKIEELEVSLTSSNLSKRIPRADSHSMEGRRMDDETLHHLQIREYDSPRLVSELCCLGEELSESLHQTLRMEGENKEDICDQRATWRRSGKDSWSEKESFHRTNHRWREATQTRRCLRECDIAQADPLSSGKSRQMATFGITLLVLHVVLMQ
ncbi:uncharacterized protein LOC119117997 [Syngnathus acus]|uniref:uncharacterized protein LOC119117997 n=1 Tax=Syngnathus acus TaxID=161584 RepID=UPI001885C8E2|nr:uncharacterized protein LOC119117997 [Syngnathus acus]